jgi:hypothetical protein
MLFDIVILLISVLDSECRYWKHFVSTLKDTAQHELTEEALVAVLRMVREVQVKRFLLIVSIPEMTYNVLDSLDGFGLSLKEVSHGDFHENRDVKKDHYDWLSERGKPSWTCKPQF